MCGKETMQAAGTVTKKLAKWLGREGLHRGHRRCPGASGRSCEGFAQRQEVLDMLDAYVDETAPAKHGGEVIEDHFWIEKIEPGKLWLNAADGG